MNSITKPYKRFSVLNITQGFHSGHQAIDCVSSYGTPLVAPENVLIEQIITPTNLNEEGGLKNGYGLWMVGQETGNRYLYWHTLPILPVWGGDIIGRGKIVAYMGNSGNVFAGGVYVPLEERNREPHQGTHLHEMVKTNGLFIDPLTIMDVSTEPTYTVGEVLASAMKTLVKLAKLLTR